MVLVERLGFSADDRLLILTCDNLGAYHAANVATYQALREGTATNASLMVPAPWARDAVRGYRGSDVGVHLTLNAEFSCYRWAAITYSPTLHSGEGGFPRTVVDLWEHADGDEVRRECRAQIERAIVWGFDPTHLDSHLNAMVLRPELFDVYLDLAVEFSLPVRLADPETEERAGFPVRDLAGAEGIVFPDRSLGLGPGPDRTARLCALIAGLEPGVTEISLQPAVDSAEVRALSPEPDDRIGDLAALCHPTVAAAIQTAGAHLTSWASLRALQQSS